MDMGKRYKEKEDGDSEYFGERLWRFICWRFKKEREKMWMVILVLFGIFFKKIGCYEIAAYQFFGLSSLPNPIPKEYYDISYIQPDLTL